MADKINDGGPAFPGDILESAAGAPYVVGRSMGMSLRDYFAAAALTGMCADGHRTMKTVADDAYRFADAMLKAREAK